MRSKGNTSDPFLSAKKKARHRLIGVCLFSLFLYFLGDVFFNLPPKYLPTDFVVETLEESRSSRELAAEYNRLNRKLGKVIGDEDIEMLKNLKRKNWFVEAGMFDNREKANLLNERLILEGYSPNLKERKVGDGYIFLVILGPFNLVKAEEIVNKMISKGLKQTLTGFKIKLIEEFTWVDIVVFVILSSSFLLSILRGLVYELSSIIVWGFSIFCAYNFGFYFSAIFPEYLSPELRTIFGSLLVLFIAILLSKMIVLSLKEIIEKSGGGSLDKIFGAFFGILRGGFIVVALSLLGTMTALTEEEAWVNAKTRAYLEFSVIQTIPYLPESVVDKIKIDFEGDLN